MAQPQVFTREFLRSAYQRKQDQLRKNAITHIVNNLSVRVYAAAEQGMTKYMMTTADISGFQNSVYKPTTEELVEAFKEKFSDCTVEYSEEWVPVPRNPDQMNKKTGITIDWS